MQKSWYHILYIMQADSIDFFFSIVVLIISVVAHEVSHGYAAYLQGDNTAYYQGRLTLNPFKHLEWFGSFILPVISYFFGGFIIGWAKPVPYNPYNLRNQRWGEALVALAGPATNLLIALIFGFFLRYAVSAPQVFTQATLTSLGTILSTIVFINLILATFNLVPIPPLDGSKILFSILPGNLQFLRSSYERYGFIILLAFIFFLWQFMLPIVTSEFHIITGLSV